MADKSDAAQFRRTLESLRESEWLGSRRWWVDYAFHHTDILNAARILQQGKLYSRQYLQDKRSQFVDDASSEIIAATDPKWLKYVRFYFRPRTPTLYLSEGFRPNPLPDKAHCPVPIYLLFDLEALICLSDSQFSDGSLARKSQAQVSKTANAFQRLPFQKIYHDRWFLPNERDEIIFHRHAEIIVPMEVTLQHLKAIWCRSEAEQETLINLLEPDTWKTWQNKITCRPDRTLFFKQWVFISDVVLTQSQVVLRFNPSNAAADSGPFHCRFELLEHATDRLYTWASENYVVKRDAHSKNRPQLTISLEALSHPEAYTVSFFIDEHLAYKQTYQETKELPF